ncbi:MAG: HAMP domain-containing histidine kinase [Clostridia bacterium]|nr:HAMP domain-containing histidine kinase [Clostridia bacterium]
MAKISKLLGIIKNLVDRFTKQHIRLSIILMYQIVSIAAIAVYKPILPILLGYPPNFRQAAIEVNASYDMQFYRGAVLFILIVSTILWALLKDINKLTVIEDNKVNSAEISRLRKKFVDMPLVLYFGHISIAVIIGLIIHTGNKVIGHSEPYVIIKIGSLLVSFFAVIAVIFLIFSKNLFRRILNSVLPGNTLTGQRVGIKSKILIQTIPIILASMLVTGVFGYSKVIEEKGNTLYELASVKAMNSGIRTTQFNNVDQALEVLKGIRLSDAKVQTYAISPKGKFISPDGFKPGLPELYYIHKPVNNDRVYGTTEEIQGLSFKVEIDNEPWTVGIIYKVTSEKIVVYFLTIFIALIIMNVLVIYYMSKSLSEDLSMLGKSLDDIAEGIGVENRSMIPVTSNDEIGDLITAFNKIQDKEVSYDQMKSEFFANISHEFRTPISIILSSIQLLDLYSHHDHSENNRNVKKITEVMKQNSYRLIRLVNNLIDTTKINASFYEINMRNSNIVSVVEEITLSVANYLKEKDIELIFDTSVEEKTLACDPDMIERMVLNLLSNAVKFTDAGGSVFVGIEDKGDRIEIIVRDTGIGISLEQQSVIFERFRQVDKSLTRKREGSGIGLSLVKSLVELHDGEITVHSEPGKGSEFIISLPVRILEEESDFKEHNKEITGDKLQSSIEKISIEFSDIYHG